MSSRFSQFERKDDQQTDEVHPIWRGLGCLLMVITPVMAYAIADLIIRTNQAEGWFPIPSEMRAPLTIPSFAGLPAITVEFILAKLAVAVLIAFVLYGILTLVYTLMFRASGGMRPSPFDAPMERRKPKKRR